MLGIAKKHQEVKQKVGSIQSQLQKQLAATVSGGGQQNGASPGDQQQRRGGTFQVGTGQIFLRPSAADKKRKASPGPPGLGGVAGNPFMSMTTMQILQQEDRN